MSSEVYKVTRETLKYLSDVWRIADNPMADNPLDVSGIDLKGLEDGQYLVVWMMACVIRINDDMKINYYAPMVYSVQSDLNRAQIDMEYNEWTNGHTNHAVEVEIWQVVDEYYTITYYEFKLPLISVDNIDGNYCVIDVKTGLVHIVDTLPIFDWNELFALINYDYEYFSQSVLIENLTILDLNGRRRWLPLSQSELNAVLELAEDVITGKGFPF